MLLTPLAGDAGARYGWKITVTGCISILKLGLNRLRVNNNPTYAGFRPGLVICRGWTYTPHTRTHVSAHGAPARVVRLMLGLAAPSRVHTYTYSCSYSNIWSYNSLYMNTAPFFLDPSGTSA